MSKKPSPTAELPPFGEWLALVQQPAVIAPRQIEAARSVVQQMADGHIAGHDNVDQAFRVVAQANDIQGLQTMLGSPECRHLKDYASPEVTYCVAHMLVDNAGNDAFAREWLETFKHSAGNARIQAGVAAKPFAWNMNTAQHMLGMSTLTNIFATGPNNGTAPWWSFPQWHDDADRRQNECYVLAAILKLQHADKLPQVEVKNSYGAPDEMNLARAIWASEHQYSHLLPALELAYDMNAPEMRREMEIGIGSAINNKRLMLKKFDSGLDSQWDGIAKWGSEHVGTPLLHCTLSTGMHLCDELMNLPFELARKRLDLMADRGARLDACILGAKIAGYDAAHQLLDIAVHAGNEAMTGHLLALGMNPTKLSEMNGRAVGRNALQIAQELEQSSNGDPKRDRIFTMVRAAAARRAAHDVLAEIDMAPAQRQGP